jgi:hypothetical protein
VNRRRLLRRLASGAVHNVRFGDFTDLVEGFGFWLARVSGSHHIYVHGDVAEPINLHNVNGQAKPYQIRQFLGVVERYNLVLRDGP